MYWSLVQNARYPGRIEEIEHLADNSTGSKQIAREQLRIKYKSVAVEA